MSPGARIGQYRLVRLLGRGAMGEVWLALDEHTERSVAIKVIMSPGQRVLEKLLRRTKGLARLLHPHIVGVLDKGVTPEGHFFMVTELLQGETLAERLTRHSTLPEPVAVGIARDVSSALRTLHEQGIIHRDIKPANIFLQRSPDATGDIVKILDAGMADLFVDSDETGVVRGGIIGSPAYMSPEQVRGSADPRSDIWAVGVVLFEMLAGERPFRGFTITEMLARICTEPARRLEDVAPHASAALCDVVRRCLEGDLDRRMPSADELSRQLHKFGPPAIQLDVPVNRGRLPRLGEVLAEKYLVRRVIGEGGMGVVFEAEHLILKKHVALKALRGSSDESIVLREARAVFGIQSEHVVRVLDVDVSEEAVPFIVMEYLEGLDLRAWLREAGQLTVPIAVDLVRQACSGLAAAHQRGLVHRDVKPANLFLTKRDDGSSLLKVCDFGLVRRIRVAPQETASSAYRHVQSTPAGTLDYMAPEQLSSPESIDFRADVWALGVVLYEMLSGARPFRASHDAGLIAAIIGQQPKLMRELRSDVPIELEALVYQCLEKDPDARPRSVEELSERLAPWDGSSSDGGPRAAPSAGGSLSQVEQPARRGLRPADWIPKNWRVFLLGTAIVVTFIGWILVGRV